MLEADKDIKLDFPKMVTHELSFENQVGITHEAVWVRSEASISNTRNGRTDTPQPL